MDEGILHSRAERYIRSLRVIPDRWWFDGTDIHMLYGNQFYQAPFGPDSTFASEGDDEFADAIFVNPGDEERSPMEISDGLQTQYRLAVSICPDYMVGDSQPQAIRDSMVFIQRLILQDRMDASSAYPQFDTTNNEIDIVFTQPVDYEDMVSMHRRLTNAVEEAEINAYVYAEFAGSLAADFYPLTYGYPSGRQAMLGRSWAAEDYGPHNLIDYWKEGDDPLELAGVYLGGAELRDAFLERANLEGAELRSADLRNADLRRANLRNADLRMANLRDASFFEANLEGANLRGADLQDANFQYANLEGVNLVNAHLDGADFRHSTGLTDEQKERINRVNGTAKEWLILESSVVIPPTETIVERVRAMQEALHVSEMQSKLIDLQTRAKLGMIRTEEELMELLLGAESFEAPRGRPVGSGIGNYTCRNCGGSGHNARTCDQPPKVPKPAPASGTMRRCSKCGQTGHNSRTCRSQEPKTGIFDRCPHCNDPGHRRDDCPDAPVREWEQPDPRDVEGFEPLVRGESKLAKSARIKRNIRRILEHLSFPPWASELAGAYRHNGGDTPWVRSESKRVPGAARNMPEVLVWRDRYYLLGPGGKEEFFRTGPGSLQG